MSERRAFFVAMGLLLLIPGIAGPTIGFLGIDGLAALFRIEGGTSAAPALRNHLRAIGWMFFSLVPLVVWSLRDLRPRAGAFRIVMGCAFLAGFARLTGRLVDGSTGVLPMALMIIELVVLPALLWWHSRLLRAEPATAARRPMPTP